MEIYRQASGEMPPSQLVSGGDPGEIRPTEGFCEISICGASVAPAGEGHMGKDVELRCRCGEVVGRVENASPQKVNRVICYCDDCQAFAHQLGRAELLNAQGGSDIVQVAPASLTFVKGQQHIAGLRLAPKGLFRWH